MNFLLAMHVLITIALIAVILLQRSEGGGLGLGGSSSNSVFTARGTANLLTHVTAILATLFIVNCLVMGMLAKSQSRQGTSILEEPAVNQSTPAAPDHSQKS